MGIVEFGRHIGKLKRLKRTGWVRMKVPDPESVAEHSFGMAVLALVLSKRKGIDQAKVVRMALIHDIGESIIGDIVTHRAGYINENLLKQKQVKERLAVNKIFSSIEAKEFVSLFDEFEKNKTPEAKLAKQLDTLEMIFQARHYEDEYGIDLGEFYQDGFTRIKDPSLLKILNTLHSTRRKDLSTKVGSR